MANLSAIDVTTVCRTCLSCSEHLISIYSATSTGITFADMLTTSTPLKFNRNDSLPKVICDNCIIELNRCHTFQAKCLESENKLRNHFDISDDTKDLDIMVETFVKTELPVNAMNIKFERDASNEYNQLLSEIAMAQRHSNKHIPKIKNPASFTDQDNLKYPEICVPIKTEIVDDLLPEDGQTITENNNIDDNVRQLRNRKEKIYSCPYCKKVIKFRSQYTHHLRTHTGEKPYSCSYCPSSFNRKDVLTIHIRTHTGEKPYLCTVCDGRFSDNSTLSKHMLTHSQKKPHACNFCERSFKIKQSLITHLRLHTGEKPYTCTVCATAFNRKDMLRVHMRRHTGEKPYSCTICNTSFNHYTTLMYHMATHSQEKPYSCTVCDRAFKVKHNLTTHMRVHIGKKPSVCSVCNITVRNKSTLKRHMRQHTGKKPYSCTVCDKSFKVMRTLTRHISTHIKQIKPE